VALADTTTNAEDMESALLEASDGIGVAATVAAEMGRTLDGALKEQSAAWEALVLSISNADTAIGGFFRTATTAGTNVLKRIKRMNTSLEELAGTKADEFMKNMVVSINGLGEGVNNTELVRNNLVAWMRVYGDAAEETAKELDDLGGKAGVWDEIGLALGGSADLVAQKNLLTDMAEGYGIAADKIEELLRNDEAFAAFLQSIKNEAAEAKKAAEAEAAAAEAKAKAAALELAKSKDLIIAKQAEIKAAQEVTASTRSEVAARTSKVEKLKEELAALQALGKEKQLQSASGLLETTGTELEDAKKAADERVRINNEANQKIVEDEKAAAAQRKAAREELKNVTIDTTAEILGNFIATNAERVQTEIAQNREKLNTDLQDEELNEAQREALKARAASQEAKLKTKLAKAEKEDALFKIGIGAAANVIKVFPNPVLMASAAALGIAQAAVVAAKPIPKFDKGSDYTPSDYIAGEKGGEFRIKDGQVSYIDKPTFFQNDAGAKIVSRVESNAILDNISRNEAINNITGYNDAVAAQMLDLAMLKLETRRQTGAIVGAINNQGKQSGMQKMNALTDAIARRAE
jgi:hypothetical protein